MWDLDSTLRENQTNGATRDELALTRKIYEWAGRVGDVQFKDSKTPSFVIRVPTRGDPINLVTLQGRTLKFYWGHFVGGYDPVTKGPDLTRSKFLGALDLAKVCCERLNKQFGWRLAVTNKDGGFAEPSVKISSFANESELLAFTDILSDVAREASTPAS